MIGPVTLVILALGGLFTASLATWPEDLRRLRPWQMVLLPVTLCCFYWACAKMGTAAGHPALARTVLLAAGAGFLVTLAPNLLWLLLLRSPKTLGCSNGPALDEEIHLAPIRSLVHAERYEAACERLEAMLRTHRADFTALFLMAQLHYQLKQNRQAEQCLLLMARFAPGEQEQLASLRLYHQLANA